MRKSFLTCLLAIFLSSSFPTQVFSSDNLVDQKWQPWSEIGGYGSTETGRTRGEVTLWAPISQSDSALLFTELKGKLFEEDQREGNFAIGYRQMLSNGWNVGFWGGYDIRRTSNGSNFGQVAFGVEALNWNWDLRLNGYVPTDTDELISRTSSSTTTGTVQSPVAQLIGNQLFLIQGGTTTNTTTVTDVRDLALWGLDGEVGARLPIGNVDDLYEFRAYAGAFYFDHSDLDTSIVGPRLRLELRANDILSGWSGSRLTLESEYQWDEVRDHQFEAGLRLRIPLSPFEKRSVGRSLSRQERRMTEALERDTDIVTQTATTATTTTSTTGTEETREAVEDALTGVDIGTVASVDGTGDLQATINNTGQNSLIIVDGSAGDVTGGVTLLSNQTLLGGGGTLQVRGLISGEIASFTAGGTRPTIRNSTSTVRVLNVDDATHIRNVDIRGEAFSPPQVPGVSEGIFVPAGTDTVYIAEADIRVNGHGVLLDSNSTNINVLDTFVQGGAQGANGNSITGQSGNTVFVTRTTLDGLGEFAFVANNTLSLNEVTFIGARSENIFDVLGFGNAVSGSGNVNQTTTVVGPECDTSDGTPGGFSGSISFVDGTVWQDNVAPCN